MADAISAKTAWALAKAIKGGSKRKGPTNGTATVVRVDQDGTHWVRISGSDVETPVNGAITVDAKAGDTVQYHLEDTRISITGNASSPSVGRDYVGGEVSVVTKQVETVRASIVETNELVAAKATIGQLEVERARISELEADHVSVSDFQAEQANIDSLQAATADIGTIRANSAKVQNLTAAQLEADHATIGTLDTTYATIANLNAANGRITNLESTKANISDLEADYITADEIDATYMHANMSNSDVAWIENGTIKDGAIVSAMINDVSANKLTAGTINGSVINVTNLNADNITVGTINGQRIGEGSLSLDKLSEDVYTEAEVDTIVEGLNDRIDGAIETHTGTVVPTLNNSPASSWSTTKLRDEHVGDVYYVVNSQSQQNGYCYRFTKSGNTYSWQLIKDSDVTAALSRLTTAEGKITTFDSDISTLKTTTGTLTTKTESLETRMSDAESDILDKVDTTTFNEVSDTVDQHSQTISQHTTAISNKADSSTVTAVTNRVSKNEQDISGINTTIGELQDTVETKADGSTVSTISNKLNTVSDTVDGHTQTLTSVQNTLSNKADSSTVSTLTTKVNNVSDTVDGHTQTISGQSTILSNNGLTSSTNITNRVSSVEQDLSGYKTTVSETYATKSSVNSKADASDVTALAGRVTTAESNISQNAQNIELKVSESDVTGNYIVGKINLNSTTASIAAEHINLQGAVTISDLSSDAQSATLNSNISVGGRNLLLGTGTAKTQTITLNTNNYAVVDCYKTYQPVPSILKADDLVTISFDWSATVTDSCNFHVECGAVTPYTWGTVVSASGGRAANSNYVDVTSSNTSGHFVVTFKVTSSQASAAATLQWLRIRVDGTAWSGKAITISNAKAERGNKATDWTPAPEDVTAYTDDAINSIEVGGRNYAKTRDSIGTTATNNGVTFTVAGPSTVTVNGTATATAIPSNAWFGGLTLDPGTYSLWLTNTNGGTLYFRLGKGASKTHVWSTRGDYSRETPYVFTVSESDEYWFGPVCPAGTYSNVETRYMLEKGNKATDWSPAPEDVDRAVSNAAKTATSYVTDITGGGIMVHPSTDDDTGVQITSDVDIMRGGTSVINIGTNDAVRIGVDDNAHVKMLLESDAMSIENESGSEIFSIDSGSTGTSTVALTASLVTWSTTASVDTTAHSVSDTGTAAGTTTVTATINGLEYPLGTTYATATVTAGTGVSVALTQAGVTYVQGLMVETVEGEEGTVTTTYPCELSVEYQHAVTDKATMSLTGSQTIGGEGDIIYMVNDKWSSSHQSNTFIRTRNTTTGREVQFGVGSGGYNRGVWDDYKGSWLIYRDKNDKTVIGGPNFSVDANGYVKSNGETVNGGLLVNNGWSKILRSSWSSSNKKTTLLYAENSVTGQIVAFGIGNDGYNRGIWDAGKSHWIVVKNQSDQVLYYGLHSNLQVTSHTVMSNTEMTGGAGKTGTTSITKSGWYPIAIAGWSGNMRYILPSRIYLSASSSGSGTISWFLYNASASTQTPTFVVYVLWARGD